MVSELYIIHENDEWLAPLRVQLDALGVPHTSWHVGRTIPAPSGKPPVGVFFNRMSASSHTRGHRSAPEQTAALLEWLEAAGRRVVNGSRALDLEVSKARQYVALARHGIEVPAWQPATDAASLLAAADAVGYPLVVKPNRGGKGVGVLRFASSAALRGTLEKVGLDFGPDAMAVAQRYVESADGTIVRAEFVGGELLYAVRVDASNGFELCPADTCASPIAEEGALCPAGGRARFEVLEGFVHPALERYQEFLRANRIEVAGIEMLTDRDGRTFTYDVNTNTNYNEPAEQAAGLAGSGGSGMEAIARFLAHALRVVDREMAAAA